MMRTMKPYLILCSAAMLLALAVLPAQAGQKLFQYSTIDALLSGVYDGDLTMGELKSHGGFGLGTLNALDGELVVLDGVAFHVVAGGKAAPAPDSARTPFATVTEFDEDTILKLSPANSLAEFNEKLVKGLPSRNAFYAIRIDGRFPWIKTRAIPAQKKPYQPLAQLVKKQVIVKYTNLKGTLVGLWSPAFVKGMNVPGFHWHFLTEDRTAGGHVLDCSTTSVVARIDQLLELAVKLPGSKEFAGANLEQDRDAELHSVEKGTAQ